VKVRRPGSVFALVAGALVLTACGNSAPPAAELAEEMIDTLDVSDTVKTCMKEELAGFEFEGFADLDEVASKADENNADALEIMDNFEAALASCTTAG
jgi:prophage tail gpP-like protein